MSNLKFLILILCYCSFHALGYSQKELVIIYDPPNSTEFDTSLNYTGENIGEGVVINVIGKGIEGDLKKYYLLRKGSDEIRRHEDANKLTFELEEDINGLHNDTFFKGKINNKESFEVKYSLKNDNENGRELASIKITFKHSNQKGIEGKNNGQPPKKVTLIPIPIFNYYPADSFLKENRKNRYLIIDATPNPNLKKNNTLFKVKEDSIGANLVAVKNIPINSSIAVLIRNYSSNNIENAIVTINGTDYSYAQDVSNLYEQATEGKDEESILAQLFKGQKPTSLKAYLDGAYLALKENKYLNINDLLRLEAYKEALKKVLKDSDLDDEKAVALSKILSWYPEYISLTPIAITAPDTDELEIKLSLKHKDENEAKEYNVGTYRTLGGLGIAINSNFFITGLKNNKVYAEIVDKNGTDELHAQINKDNQLSIGIGINSEVSYRTGSIFRPTLNVGFFVPFEEDITPYFAIGPGISIGTKKVKFSLTGGLALGKVNKIAEQYRDKDLTQFDNLANENLSEKVWKSSWQIGIGVSFNLPGK